MTKDHLIVWNKTAYEVGIKHIDNQHRTLVDYINELAWAIDNKQEQSIIFGLFFKFYDYTKFHFKAEEAYFTSLNKNDCLLHQLQHKHFIEELDNIIDNKQLESITAELLFFLSDCLLHHIQIEDKKYLQLHQV